MRCVMFFLFGAMTEELAEASGVFDRHSVLVVLMSWAVTFAIVYFARRPITRWLEN